MAIMEEADCTAVSQGPLSVETPFRNGASFSDCPVEILLNIVHHLPQQDTISCMRLCTTLRDAIVNDPACWKTLIIPHRPEKLVSQVEHYKLHHSAALSLINRVEFVKGSSYKHVMHLNYQRIFGAAGTSQIQSVHGLDARGAFDTWWPMFRPHLRYLHLEFQHTGPDLQTQISVPIDSAPQLEVCSLKSLNKQVGWDMFTKTNPGTFQFITLRTLHLQNICVTGYMNQRLPSSWNDGNLVHNFIPFPKLKHLELDSTRFSHTPLTRLLVAATPLEHLKSKQSLKGEPLIAHLPTLQTLNLDSHEIFPIPLNLKLSHVYPHLTILRLCKMHCEIEQLECLSHGSPLIRSVSLERVGSLEAAVLLEALSRWKELEHLHLQVSPRIDNDFITGLSTFAALRSVHLANYPALTDSALVNLVKGRLDRHRCVKLEEMELERCRNIDDASLEWLKKNLGRFAARTL